MVAINGTDSKSIIIMDALNTGVKVKEVPKLYGISLDQAKRLSRLLNLFNQSLGKISLEAHEKLKQLGTKALVLYPLTKQKDWDGLNDILYSISPNITRDELTLLVPALMQKRETIQSFEKEVDRNLAYLEKKNEMLLQQQEELDFLQSKIQKQVQFLQKYDKLVRLFLLEHLGLTKDGQLCLSKRLDYRWQKNLQRKEIIVFNKPPHDYYPHNFDWMEKHQDSAYTYLVKNLDAMAEELPYRWKRGWDCAWNYEKERKRAQNTDFVYWDIPEDPSYKNVQELAKDLKGEINQVIESIMEIESEKQAIKLEIEALRKETPKTFLDKVAVSNKLSERELKRHGQLQDIALKWLYNKGFAAVPEFTLDNGKRIDVLGYNEDGHVIAIEVKASRNDYISDHKWADYLKYCDEFYFLLDNPIWFRNSGAGLLKLKGKGLVIENPCTLDCKAEQKEKLIYEAARRLSRTLIFG
ncbi:DNA repair protein MmcB-related protein [Neobacillus notoginsengisoli]|uniref:DNA repair protein MmcB-related protein n=1 Tax=Neobacillus notoginsengisoli TaxID=1578198 RepID=A0A417YQ73_9BACI|nr:MmcB family DNA repair protein [Neobacillus notoginsengisoli]RHW36000.1 DNA repair protein MmcB-related protein [Neobacillus notoginsengisoli]